MATVAKKKRSGRGNDLEEQGAAATTKRPRGADDEQQQEDATEEEVEEFFAILRRIRESAAGFAPGRGGGARRRPGSADETEGRTVIPAWRWRPSFEWEDFGEATVGRGNENKTTPPAAEDVEEEKEDGDGDEEEEEEEDMDVAEPAAEDGLRRRFDLNLEPSPSEELSAVAIPRRYERKLH